MKSFSAQHRTQTLSGYETTGNPVIVRTQKETGLLLKAEMVIATLEDRKTKTRRLRGLETLNSGYYKDRIAKVECRDGLWCFWEIGGGSSALSVFTIKCPYGGRGDILYCKETFRRVCAGEIKGGDGKLRYGIQYRADNFIHWNTRETKMSGGWKDTETPMQFQDVPWKPSIFMPRWASRITLEIMEVRVERLNEITEEDAMSEGVDWKDHAGLASKTAKKLFAQLWDSINGKKFPWSGSPWVWVITFKRI